MSTVEAIAPLKQCSNTMECYAVTPVEPARYRVTTHIAFPTDITIDPCPNFRERWHDMLKLAKQNMPSVLVHTTEIRALITMLENPLILNMVQTSIGEFNDTSKGFLKFLESDMCRLLPLTARTELFSFVQMFICPRSYYYPNVELLICRNLSLMEFLMIGHCQLDGFIFDGATPHSHAVVAAKSIGKQVLLTKDDLYFPHSCTEIEVTSMNFTEARLFWD